MVWQADIAARHAVRDSTLQASPAVRVAAEAANWWGGPGVIWFGMALWLGARVLGRQSAARVGLRGIEALAVASGLSGILKGLAGRARPFVVPDEPWHWEFNRGWTEAQFFSMPSGHTTATTACAVAMALALASGRPAIRWPATITLVASALFVAFARMYADQHWASDIVVAMILGSTTAAVLARVHRSRVFPRYDRALLGSAR